MSTRTTALWLGGGTAMLLGAALWLAVSVSSRPVVEEGRAPQVENTPPGLPPPPTAPPSSGARPPVQAPQSPAAQRQQMAQLKEEMGVVVQGIHKQLASGRPTTEVLADLRRIRTEYRQRLGTQSEVASITMEELDELEQQLLLRAHAQGQR
ncbi:MAG TPA: hypothetical protein VH877_16565 [Polyangia bacterium]|nr:hypothetical protein [Polyangia bacterium]